MYKWFFAWRYLHTRLIALFGIISVTLCVAMVLIVLSVMGGFLDTLRERARGLLADLVLDAGLLQGWPYYEEFDAYLQGQASDIVGTTSPVIHNYGILRVPSSNYTKPVQVAGIKLDSYPKVNDFRRSLHYEKYYPGSTTLAPQRQPFAGFHDDKLVLPEALQEANARWRADEKDSKAIKEFDALPYALAPSPGPRVYEAHPDGPVYDGDEWPGIIVGNDVINRRESDGSTLRFFPRGSLMVLTLVPITPAGNPLGEQPVKLFTRQADDSRTGVYEIDSRCVYVDFDMLQHALAMDAQPHADGGFTAPRTTQLLIALKPGTDLHAAQARIRGVWEQFLLSLGERPTADEMQALRWVDIQTWEDMQRPFIAAVEKEKVLVTFLFAIISVVTIVLIGCIFYMIVKNKTRDIGILKAIGASNRGVATLFLVYAGAVGVVGSILGIAIGAVFVWYINDIQALLIHLNPKLRVWDPSVYSFDTIPHIVKIVDAVGIAVVAVAASIVGALIPARLAGKVWPVEALRYE